MRLTSLFYGMARTSAWLRVLSSGNPKRVARRYRNKLVLRGMNRFFRW